MARFLLGRHRDRFDLKGQGPKQVESSLKQQTPSIWFDNEGLHSRSRNMYVVETAHILVFEAISSGVPSARMCSREGQNLCAPVSCTPIL